ncbi:MULTISPECIES: hypothetical protein [unclassified Flavobacterium]|uniref:hypothetical protein n=1 Tax=unclassified Flavobacterium TaxID=196869 RepID=UPI001AC20BAF|nr:MULTISPECIES: hypothetical protein [unclassified Flavobacterium]MBN9284150.1 hypothetical protein [Flavobacterium sp.]
MKNIENISTLRLILIGYLWINIPLLLIIFCIAYISSSIFNLTFREGVIVGVVIGWIYWHYSIKFWILWALKSNVKSERLLSVGRSCLLL